jgi:hypothetical protein
LFFDRDEEFRETLCEALRQRDSQIAPTEALRLLAHRLVAGQSPLVEFSASSQRFIEMIESSETLKARAGVIRDERAELLAAVLSECAGRESTDSGARLAAGLFLTTWTVAARQAHWVFRQSEDTDEAKAAFLALVEQGIVGMKAAMNGTPYA